MARPAKKELGVLGILREVLAVPLRNQELVAFVLFFLLLPCNLLLTVPKLSPRLTVNIAPLVNRLPLPWESPHGQSPPGMVGIRKFAELPVEVFAPLDYAVTELSTAALVYVSAVAYQGRHSTRGALLSKVRGSWKKVAISSLYVQLFHFAEYTRPFLFVGALAMFGGVLFLVVYAMFSMILFAVVFSLYLDVACRLSLVVSAVEEDKCGVAALGRAVSLAGGRKLQGLILLAVMLVAKKLFTSGRAASLVVVVGGERLMKNASFVVAWRSACVLADLSARLFGWLLWTVYYYECRKTRALMGKEEKADERRSLVAMASGANDDLI